MKHLNLNFLLKTTLIVILAILTGCASQPKSYPALKASDPTSILVIPPDNETVEVNAPYVFLSTITAPLAERGYYVFPVAVIDQFMKDNGLPTPAEMNRVPLDKINEIIGPDAVLYINIDDWGQSYQLIQSVAVVSSTWKLVDARTGHVLWSGKAYAQQSSGDGGGDLVGMLVSAAIEQVAGSLSDNTPFLSRNANSQTAGDIPPGPYLRKARLAESK